MSPSLLRVFYFLRNIFIAILRDHRFPTRSIIIPESDVVPKKAASQLFIGRWEKQQKRRKIGRAALIKAYATVRNLWLGWLKRGTIKRHPFKYIYIPN